jgi:hypothetical protein
MDRICAPARAASGVAALTMPAKFDRCLEVEAQPTDMKIAASTSVEVKRNDEK